MENLIWRAVGTLGYNKSMESYKDKEWCREQFVIFLGEGYSFQDDAETELPLEKLIQKFPDKWADFCVLEGVSKKIST